MSPYFQNVLLPQCGGRPEVATFLDNFISVLTELLPVALHDSMFEAIAKVVSTTRNTTWGAKGDFSFALDPRGRAQLSGSADECALGDFVNRLIDAAMSLLGPLGFELVRFIEMLTIGTDIVLQDGRVAFGAGGHQDRLDVVKLLVPFCAPGTGRGLRFKGGGAPPDCVVTYPHCGAIFGSAAGFNTEEFGGMPGLIHASVPTKCVSFLAVLRFRMPSRIIDVVDHPFLDDQSIFFGGAAAASAATTFDYLAASRPVLSVSWKEASNAEVRMLRVCSAFVPPLMLLLAGGSHAECDGTRGHPRLGGHHGARFCGAPALGAEHCDD